MRSAAGCMPQPEDGPPFEQIIQAGFDLADYLSKPTLRPTDRDYNVCLSSSSWIVRRSMLAIVFWLPGCHCRDRRTIINLYRPL